MCLACYPFGQVGDVFWLRIKVGSKLILYNPGPFILILPINQEMSKLVYKQKIDPDSFDRETILLGIWETQLD